MKQVLILIGLLCFSSTVISHNQLYTKQDNLQATIIAPSTVKLSWTFLNPTCDLYANIVTLQNKNGNQKIVLRPLQSSYVIREVEQGFTHTYYVSAECLSRQFKELTTQIKLPPNNPSAPRNLQITSVSDTSLKATWDPPDQPNGPLGMYKVEIVFPMSPDLTQNVEGTEATFNNLQSATTYAIRVTAQTKPNLYGPSIQRAGSTLPSTSQLPLAPTNLKVKLIGSTAALVSWNAVSNVPVTGYLVQNCDLDQECTTTLISAPKLTHAVLNLKAKTNYTVTVWAQINSYKGDPSTSVYTTGEGVPTLPPNIKVTQINANEIQVTWNVIKKIAELTLTPKMKITLFYLNVMQTFEVDLSAAKLKISDIPPNTMLTLHVQQINLGPNGGRSKVMVFDGIQSWPAAAQKLENLMLPSLGSTYIYAQWSDPNPKSVYFKGYVVNVTLISSTATSQIFGNIVDTSYNITNLRSFAKYTVEVFAENYPNSAGNGGGVGPGIKAINQTTAQNAQPPSEVKATVKSDKSLSIKWIGVPHVPGFIGYIVTISNTENDIVFVKENIMVDVLDVQNLEPFAMYTVAVQTQNGKTDYGCGGTVSAISTTRTQMLPGGSFDVIPGTLVVDAANNLLATWSSPEGLLGVVNYYELKAIEASNSAQRNVFNVSGSLHYYSIKGLTPGATYNIFVTAYIKPTFQFFGGGPGKTAKIGTIKITPGSGIGSGSSSGISGGAIAGIVIGVLALLALVAVIAFILIRRNRIEDNESIDFDYVPYDENVYAEYF